MSVVENTLFFLIHYYPENINKYGLSKNPNFLIIHPNPKVQFTINNQTIKKYEELISWIELSQNPNFLTNDQNFNVNILEKYHDQVCWMDIIRNPNFLTKITNPLDIEINDKIINHYKKYISWIHLVQNPNFLADSDQLLNDLIMKKYADNIDIHYLSKNPNFLISNKNLDVQIQKNDEIIEKYQNKINWSFLFMNPKFLTSDIEKNEQILKKYRKIIEKYNLFDYVLCNPNFPLTNEIYQIYNKFESFLKNFFSNPNFLLTETNLNKLLYNEWKFLSNNPNINSEFIKKISK